MKIIENPKLRKGDRTRAHLIHAFMEQVYRKGYDAVTFESLARASEVSQPALYKYFSNKLDLYFQSCVVAASSGQQYIDSFVDDSLSSKEALKSYILGNLRWMIDRPKEAYLLIGTYYFSQIEERIKKVHLEIEAAGLVRIQNLLERGVREGAWMRFETPSSALRLRNQMVGEMMRLFYQGEPELKKSYRRICKGLDDLTPRRPKLDA